MSDIQYVLMIIGAATCVFVLFLFVCLLAFLFIIGLDGYQARQKVRHSKHQSAGKVYDFPEDNKTIFFEELKDRRIRLEQEAQQLLRLQLKKEPVNYAEETMLMPAHLSVVKPSSTWEQIDDHGTPVQQSEPATDFFNVKDRNRESDRTPQPL